MTLKDIRFVAVGVLFLTPIIVMCMWLVDVRTGRRLPPCSTNYVLDWSNRGEPCRETINTIYF